MLRKDRVRQYILQQSGDRTEGFTAQEVADALGIWRNDAAVELNKLVAEGVLTRSGKKNVRFLPCAEHGADAAAAVDDCAFRRLVGYDGSLKHQISVAKAAVSYPPHGLNMLVTGMTGVGKTKFAHAIWEYANETHAFGCTEREVPFVHFNCAEYADNPQLLLSNLFGYKKGAFTGALTDKSGLVEEADGGILFLDEIHCLSATSQELFFTLLDTGFFRRIGDNIRREAHFMLIGATTKSISSALMDTFVRRMPVLIQIPSLSERPLNERPEFIRFFYGQEARHIGCPICVKADVLNALMEYTSRVNLGTLKNAIQMSCAKAFLRSGMRRDGDCITVTIADLIFQIHAAPEAASVPIRMKKDWFSEDMYIGTHQPEAAEPKAPQFVDIYDLLVHLTDESQKSEMSREELQQMMLLQLDGYFEDLRKASVSNQDSTAMEGLLSPQILPISAELIGLAAVEMDHAYPRKAPLLLGMHLNQYVNRVRSGNPVLPQNIQDILGSCRQELQFAKTQRSWLEASLGVPVTDDELGFLAIFLRQIAEQWQKPNVYLTLCSCSEGGAANIGTYVSTLFDVHHIHCLDSRTVDTPTALFDRVCRSLRHHHGESGNLLFTDVQYLAGMEESIRQATGVPCIVVPVLEMRLVMIACRVSMTQGLTLEQAYSAIISDYCDQVNLFFRSTRVENLPLAAADPTADRTRVIFTTCITGVGSAESIKVFLEQRLHPVMPVTVIAVSSLDNIAERAAEYGMDLKLIIGTVNPNIPGVPFLFADTIFTPNGIDRVLAILSDWGSAAHMQGVPREAEQTDRLLSRNFNTIAPKVDGETGIRCIGEFLRTVETCVYGHRLPENIRTRVFMHAAGMLERIVDGNTLEMIDEGRTVILNDPLWFRCLSALLRDSFTKEGFPVSEAEVFYFMLTLPEPPDADILQSLAAAADEE